MHPIESTDLSNGVVVLSEHMPHTLGVGISVLIDAGPQDEQGHQSGLAHLCEHAFFLGTKARSEQQIAELIDSAGGHLGGFTARDYTCLHATISSDYLTYAVDLLGDMLNHVEFSDDRLAREVEIVGHEIDEHHDEVDGWIDSQLKEIMWPGDSLGRSILGTRESLESLRRHDVLDFINSHYRSNRIIVGAAGNVNHSDFVEQVNDSLWQLSSGAQNRPADLARPRGGVQVEPREQRCASITMMIPVPEYTSPDRYCLHVLVALLGGGMSSRLYRELRESTGLAYSVATGLNAYRRGGVITIEVSTSPDAIMQCVLAVYQQLMQLAFDESAVTDEELWKAKMQVRGQTYLSSDSITTRVSRLVTQQHYFGTPLETNDLLREIDEVSNQSLCQVAARVISQGLPHAAIGVAGIDVNVSQVVENELNDLRECFGSAAI